MKITDIQTFRVAIPLHTPFKTALRTVTVAETIVTKVTCDNGVVGWGEAPPTHVITGDSLDSIEFAINGIFKPLLMDESLANREEVFEKIHGSMVGNSSAKAAMDMALYDCIAQRADMPLYQFIGGYQDTIETDYTVSVNSPEEMARDARKYVDNGFSVLKIKVGKDLIETDIKRIEAIRKEIGSEVVIRLDANQGWKPKEAVQAIRKMEERGLNIELIEQPVKAHDFDGLKYVTDNTETAIMADESVFSSYDAKRILEMGAADLINIKLMKAGGIHQAVKIAKLADSYGVECMVGSMIETKIGITAAAHFAASQPNVTRFDFDAPLMLAGDIADGGITYKGRVIELGSQAGLGIRGMDESFLIEK
ncbi:dipeptide epimerase [Oceanobacillus halophilus]|uniref:Dipeptide epimerase n=1 Tax=Oceanobacillus halophilus TaxID=930130 RepID=A0A495A459_9BACI|nr:dipeptide epimerase [Oceanobacillus halophilus]RKQ34360.1 dipeptide epimerase [Oceanobacillus halophilus]